MSGAAETIRRAAKLMRERAAAATPGPWWFDEDDRVWRLHGVHAVIPAQMFPGTDEVMIPEQVMNHQILKAPKQGTSYAEYWPNEADAAQIVSWHPGVAVAVADWLDEEAADYDGLDDSTAAFRAGDKGGDPDPALRVARLYLGEQP